MGAKKINNENGQALIEFILFIPFMLMLYFSILSMGNAINASINQQKITRGYFYYRMANNSMLPKPRRDGNEPTDAWRIFGMQIMGWAQEFQDDNPVAPCFKFNLPFKGSTEDSCESSYGGTSTQFIRVQTVYGVCGATYTKDGSTDVVRHPSFGDPKTVIGRDACSIVE